MKKLPNKPRNSITSFFPDPHVRYLQILAIRPLDIIIVSLALWESRWSISDHASTQSLVARELNFRPVLAPRII